jgi:predicted O-methyltransferase YrrM
VPRARRAVETPPSVLRAQELARTLGFTRSCSDETGRLLHVLAGERGRRRVAELGTGAGVGAAWIVSALDPAATFVSVEVDAGRAAAAGALFRDDEHVRVLAGDWHELLPLEAPFDLVFLDAGKSRPELDGEQVVALLAPRGLVVMDDLRESRPVDAVREFWLGHPRLAAVELTVSAEESVILAVRTH